MTIERTMKELSLEERKDVLVDLMKMSTREVMEKYNISKNTVGHIKYFHGRSGAVANGDYHKDLTKDITDPAIEKIKEVKARGGNSGEAAEASGISLEKVNKLWIEI